MEPLVPGTAGADKSLGKDQRLLEGQDAPQNRLALRVCCELIAEAGLPEAGESNGHEEEGNIGAYRRSDIAIAEHTPTP